MQIIELTGIQAQEIIKQQSLPEELITATRKVAAIFTQGWCPQWTFMLQEMKQLESEGTEADLTVYTFVYDQSPLFDQFRVFKESVWKNDLVPYVRYYKDGAFTGESNYVSREFFLSQFK